MKTLLLVLISVSLVFASCTNTAKEHSDTNTNVNASTQQKADSLIKDLDAKSTSVKPKKFEMTIKDVNACDVEDYGQKKRIFCFDGGMKALEALVYYAADGEPAVAIYTIEKYNASPANQEAFDESKTVNKTVKLYFKEGSLNLFEKIVDMKGKSVTLDEEQKENWNIITAATPPM